jgi:hypothetical protein
MRSLILNSLIALAKGDNIPSDDELQLIERDMLPLLSPPEVQEALAVAQNGYIINLLRYWVRRNPITATHSRVVGQIAAYRAAWDVSPGLQDFWNANGRGGFEAFFRTVTQRWQ